MHPSILQSAARAFHTRLLFSSRVRGKDGCALNRVSWNWRKVAELSHAVEGPSSRSGERGMSVKLPCSQKDSHQIPEFGDEMT